MMLSALMYLMTSSTAVGHIRGDDDDDNGNDACGRYGQ